MPEPGRLHLPAGYGEFEPFTIETAPSWDDFEPRLESARTYWVAVSDDLGPHVVPVWGIWSDLSFTFTTDPASRKGRALAQGSRLSIHLESGDDVVIVQGRAEVLPADLIDRFLDAYVKKYAVIIDPEDPTQIMYRLVPELAMTWVEEDFARTAARWEF